MFEELPAQYQEMLTRTVFMVNSDKKCSVEENSFLPKTDGLLT
jgi:hypothetical protein